MPDLQSLKTVRFTFQPHAAGNRIAIVTIDHPPVNAGSMQLRRDLLDVFTLLRAEDDLAGAVLIGANGNFVAGSDIREFDGAPLSPHLPEVIAAIEACPFPVIAAIEGAALGGGYELALGCDFRLARPNALVGLPEVTLGLIPGAGGTYRLPRLVGPAKAIGLITSGRRVKADEALDLGMIDAITENDLLSAAIEQITANPPKRILRQLAARSDSPAEMEAAEKAALRKAAGSLAAAEAITAVKASASPDADTVLEQEREASLRLRRGPQSQALRHLFFAEREAARPPEGATPKKIAIAGVAGAGRMGVGIALAFASRGIRVRLAEQNPDVLAAARQSLAEQAEQMAARGRAKSAVAITDLVSDGPLEDMADCDLVIEAITEDMQAKKSLFTQLAAIVADDAILASNTSYLDINELAADIKNRERVAGLHFFNPAHIMKLVEVVQAEHTSIDVVASLLGLCRKLGKIPVVAQVGEGFIGNRIFNAYRAQCEFLLEEGCYPEDIDQAMTEFGMAMGPFAVFDLSGLDVAWAMRKRLAPTRDPKARYVSIADTLCEEGRFGRRTGKGWYDYSSGKATPDSHVQAVIDQASADKNIIRKSISSAEIQSRILAAIVNEAAWVLADGIAARSADIDLVLVNGYGFPALMGGPLHWAAHQPRAAFLTSIATMAAASEAGVTIAPNLRDILDQAEAL